MQALLKRRVIVFGGYGEFSRQVAAGVAALPQGECVLGLPQGAPAAAFASSLNVPFMALDPNDPSSLQRMLEGAFAVVNLLGPFSSQHHLALAARCATKGVHYVDPADSRAYFTEFTRLAPEARAHNAALVTGAGAAPAVTLALASMLAEEFDRVNEIHIFLTPGLDDRRELAVARAVLGHTTEPLRLKKDGRWSEEHWWERPQTVLFPEPVGRRRGYLCDLPDLELAVKQFGARTVTARAGFAPGLVSLFLATSAFLRRRGVIKGLSPFAGGVVRAAARMTRKPAEASAIRVVMLGTKAGVEQEHVACLIGRNGAGPAIAAAPIVAIVRRWLEHGVREGDASVCANLIKFADLKPELAAHDVVLVRQ